MLNLASWIRACDDEYFGQFFVSHPEIVVHNARLASVDPREMDGLLVTGGPDISAEFHTAPPRDLSLIRNPEPLRDAWEIAAVQTAYARGLPMLCICKGMQVLNVALGGTLHLHIEGHDTPELKTRNLQPLRYSAGARHRYEHVNSSHHQALDHLADGLEIEAWSRGDGVIEQVRSRDFPWALGVQYHPERDMIYAGLFEDFFAQLKSHAPIFSHV
jgi:putative glutamine amidotransferase